MERDARPPAEHRIEEGEEIPEEEEQEYPWNDEGMDFNSDWDENWNLHTQMENAARAKRQQNKDFFIVCCYCSFHYTYNRARIKWFTPGFYVRDFLPLGLFFGDFLLLDGLLSLRLRSPIYPMMPIYGVIRLSFCNYEM